MKYRTFEVKKGEWFGKAIYKQSGEYLGVCVAADDIQTRIVTKMYQEHRIGSLNKISIKDCDIKEVNV